MNKSKLEVQTKIINNNIIKKDKTNMKFIKKILIIMRRTKKIISNKKNKLLKKIKFIPLLIKID